MMFGGETVRLEMRDFINSNLSLREREHILDMQLILRKVGEWLDENPDQRHSIEDKLLEIDVAKSARKLLYKLKDEERELYKHL